MWEWRPFCWAQPSSLTSTFSKKPVTKRTTKLEWWIKKTPLTLTAAIVAYFWPNTQKMFSSFPFNTFFQFHLDMLKNKFMCRTLVITLKHTQSRNWNQKNCCLMQKSCWSVILLDCWQKKKKKSAKYCERCDWWILCKCVCGSTSRFQKPSLALMNYVPIKNRILHSCNSLRMKSFDCVKVFREKIGKLG